MKRLLITASLFLGLLVSGMAQTATKTDDKAAIAAQKKADKEKKKADKEAAKTAAAPVASTGTNKDGSPDMRLKKNKDAAKAAAAATPAPVPAASPAPVQKVTPKAAPATVTSAAPAAQKVAPQSSVKTTDKAVSTDAKGRTIYEGPRGGKYYINKNGNKEYVK